LYSGQHNCWQWGFYLVERAGLLDEDADLVRLAATVRVSNLIGALLVAEFIDDGKRERLAVVPYRRGSEPHTLECAVLEADGASPCTIPLHQFRAQAGRTIWGIKEEALVQFKVELQIRKKKCKK